MMSIIIPYATTEEGVFPPQYAHLKDAGADLKTIETFVIPPMGIHKASTGLRISIPTGYVGLIHPRSGMATKGITVVNSPGTIDSGYTGEILVPLINLSREEVLIEAGTRVAQILFQKVETVVFQLMDELDNSDSKRGAGGFGSTGTN